MFFPERSCPVPYINGLGVYAPEKIIDNAYLEKLVETSDEWITSRTGIKRRRMAADDEITSDLACKASLAALKDCGRSVNDITHVFVSSASPDALCPVTACVLIRKLGIKGVMAFDCNAACSGFINALQLANYTAMADPNAVILVVAAEIMTRKLDWTDRTTCVLFGDGAGAVIVSRNLPQNPQGFCAEIDDILIDTDGEFSELISIHAGGSRQRYSVGDPVDRNYFISMNGREVFKQAVRSMVEAARSILERNRLSLEDISLVIPHQANDRIIQAVGDRLDVPVDKLFSNVSEYGNTSSASVTLALHDARNADLMPKGGRVLLTTFGGGFIWTAALLNIL
ncbi:MAG: ketoacyl-ACP synthase III [Desulfovibrionaceae bacterium]|nr:ketoacyl-ACP synthase III [Desulfovibrionaceae bacterium]